MNKAKTGGPIIEVPRVRAGKNRSTGVTCWMDLRDYFAGQALATMKLSDWSDNPLYWEGVARTVYVCADALLAEREKGQP